MLTVQDLFGGPVLAYRTGRYRSGEPPFSAKDGTVVWEATRKRETIVFPATVGEEEAKRRLVSSGYHPSSFRAPVLEHWNETQRVTGVNDPLGVIPSGIVVFSLQEKR